MNVTSSDPASRWLTEPALLHLYVASDADKTVVSRLAPQVAGTCEHFTTGAITRVQPGYVSRPEYPGAPRTETVRAEVLTDTPRSGATTIGGIGAAVGAVSAAGLTYVSSPWLGLPIGVVLALAGGVAALWRFLHVERVWTAGHLVITDHDDRDLFEAGRAAIGRTLRGWPAVRGMVDLDDPSATLARSLWDLAALIVERAPIRETRAKVSTTMRTVPQDSAVRRDLAGRLAQADAAVQQLDAQIEGRLTDLKTLADEVGRFVERQHALASARAVVQDADRILGAAAPLPVAGDAAAELAERTAAVLAAYRELTGQDVEQP